MIFIHCSLVGYSVALVLRGHGSKFHGSPESFSGFLRNCINCVHNCEDRPLFVLNIIVSNHSVKVIVIHLLIRSTLCHIARNYVHKESLDYLIILIQTLFLLLHIQAYWIKGRLWLLKEPSPSANWPEIWRLRWEKITTWICGSIGIWQKVTRNMIFYQRFTLERMWLTSLIQILWRWGFNLDL